MSSTKLPQQNEISHQKFLDMVETAKGLYTKLIEKTPYVDFITIAYAQHRGYSAFDKDRFDLRHQSFKGFLKGAGLLTAEGWERNKEFIIPTTSRLELFNDLSQKILNSIKEKSPGSVDYEEVRQIIVQGVLKESAVGWYSRLKKTFDYFNEYKDYLNDAIDSSKIAAIASEAKKNLKTTRQITQSQEKMLEKSGALARANVYYELAYGAPKTTKGSNEGGRRRGYRENARLWLFAVIASIIGTFGAALVTFVVIGIDFTRPPIEVIALMVAKALVLIPLLYLIRFTVHSYRVNKHLEVVYAHRWALHRTLESYIEVGESKGKESSLRMGQMNQITPFFYSEIETGYITKKDGLGDKSIEVVPKEQIKVRVKS